MEKALEILKECLELEKIKMKGYEHLSNIAYIQEAIYELEEAMNPKTCDRQIFYKCVHCGETFKIIKEVEEHENDCNYNPIAHKCDTCKSLIWEYGNDYCPFWKEKGTYDIWDNREKCPFHETKDNA